MTYPRSERETTAVYDAETRTWTLYTCEPKHRRRLTRLYGAPHWTDHEDNGGARWDRLPARVIGFRQPVAKRRVEAKP